MNPDQNNPFLQPKGEDTKNKIKTFVIDVMQSVAIALTISIFLYLFIITPNEVDGPSMKPNFHTGDLLFTSKLHDWFNGSGVGKTLGFNYKRGDVIVFQKPGNPDFVKRIIAVPGETISIKDGSYYINGKKLEEDYQLENAQKRDGEFLKDGESGKTLQDGEYFVSGDNRDESYDSRSLGFIKEDWIKGRVIFRFWPYDQVGYIGHGKTELVDGE